MLLELQLWSGLKHVCELSWIYSSWKSCLVHVYQSSLRNLTHSRPFISIQPWAGFCSQKLSVLLNFSSRSTSLSPAIVLPVQYCLLPFCDLYHHDFSITLNFFFPVIIRFCEIGLETFQDFSSHFLPHPHFVCLFPSELALLIVSSLMLFLFLAVLTV